MPMGNAFKEEEKVLQHPRRLSQSYDSLRLYRCISPKGSLYTRAEVSYYT